MNKRPLYVAPAKRTFMIPVNAWNVIAIYKVFWPPETTMKLGSKVVALKDLFPWPPPEQGVLLDVPVEKKKIEKNTDMG